MTGFDRAVPSGRHAFSDLLGERLGMLGLENSDPQAIARLLKARGDTDILQALPPWLADQPALPASATATSSSQHPPVPQIHGARVEARRCKRLDW
ncbi:hypothetical protein ACH4VM_36865 [Streptomyces sp. NPDC020792]|uniref:hypothetical protein n=1 Tax=Streptomyces sp. NPDC020792 TaxID=3365089 RepID=UPI00378BC70C